ncbi:MAG: 50S ribosomal protein L11 methyltransferase [Eubacteriales bacterium]
MDYIEVLIKTTFQAEDAVSEVLLEAGAAGVVIRDNTDPKIDDDCIALDEKKDLKDGESLVSAYFADDEKILDVMSFIRNRLDEIRESVFEFDLGSLNVNTSKVNDLDWANSWKKYFKPFSVEGDIFVKPTWADFDAPAGSIVLNIDPGMAFGTGTHETTKLCIKALKKHVKKGDTVADIGCGSGILAIAAANFGAKDIYALDRDTASIDAAKKNIEINGFDSSIKVIKSDLLKNTPSFKADVIVANIIADIIIKLNKTIKPFLKEDGTYIVSGIIADRMDEVITSLNENGFDILDTDEMGEWRVITAKRKDNA